MCVCVCVCVMHDDRCRLENKCNQSFTIAHVEFVVGAEGMAISKLQNKRHLKGSVTSPINENSNADM